MLSHLCELLQGLVVSLCASEHQTQVKHRCYECAAILERLLEIVNGIVDLFFLEIPIGLWSTCYLLSFCLIRQTLCVIELRVLVFPLDSAFEVGMCFFKVLLVEVHVAPIKVVVCIRVIQLDCPLVLFKGPSIVTLVVQGQT